jgi:copper(I)-binding protein
VKRSTTHWGLVSLAIVMAAGTVSCNRDAGIEISNAWGRPSPSVATTGAFFMTITNNGSEDDALIGAFSPACGTVELHESYMDAQGAMAMRPVAGSRIAVPAGDTAVLEQGGLHAMCINKLEEFTEGAGLDLTLQFEKAGDIPLTVEIREP